MPEGARLQALVENLRREDLNAIERTEGIMSVLELLAGLGRGQTLLVLAPLAIESRRLRRRAAVKARRPLHAGIPDGGCSRSSTPCARWMGLRSFVSNRLPLLNLPAGVRGEGLAYTKARMIDRAEPAERSCWRI